ncbi:MAG TPA: TRAP transporter small permease subunit [Burkholderiales bacterium]|nr:TRAP transporter small permease subunit [Burkholderiales bacterium]
MFQLADRTARWLAYAGMALLCGAMLVQIADIAARRTLGFSILGTIDLTQLGVMGCVFLAMPLAFLRGTHVGVEFLTDRLPRPLLRLVKLGAGLIGAAFMLALAWYGLLQAQIQLAQGDKSVTLGIPMILYWLPLLAGSLASAATALIAALGALRAPEAG